MRWSLGEPSRGWIALWGGAAVGFGVLGLHALEDARSFEDRAVPAKAEILSRTVHHTNQGRCACERELELQLLVPGTGRPVKTFDAPFIFLDRDVTIADVRYDPEDPSRFLPSWLGYGSPVEGPFSLAAVAAALGVVQTVRCATRR